jgi:hypothetical protein
MAIIGPVNQLLFVLKSAKSGSERLFLMKMAQSLMFQILPGSFPMPWSQLLHQPGLWVEGYGVFPDLKSQLGNTIAIDRYVSDILVGHYLLTFLNKDFFQA